jgi:hypothetical protein
VSAVADPHSVALGSQPHVVAPVDAQTMPPGQAPPQLDPPTSAHGDGDGLGVGVSVGVTVSVGVGVDVGVAVAAAGFFSDGTQISRVRKLANSSSPNWLFTNVVPAGANSDPPESRTS